MSVLGTSTSRTIVSVKSRTEEISSFSWASSASSSSISGVVSSRSADEVGCSIAKDDRRPEEPSETVCKRHRPPPTEVSRQQVADENDQEGEAEQ